MKFIVNFLSAFRITAAFAIIPTMLVGWYWTSLALYVLGSLSDFFDGYWARKYNVCTKLGGVMDHIGDKLLVTNTLIMLAIILSFFLHPSFVPYTAPWMIIIPTIIMISRELYISGLREFLGTQKIEMPVPKARFSMGKIKTTLQMVATTVLLLALCMPSLIGLYDIQFAFIILMYVGLAGLWLSLIASLWSATEYTFTFVKKLKQIK